MHTCTWLLRSSGSRYQSNQVQLYLSTTGYQPNQEVLGLVPRTQQTHSSGGGTRRIKHHTSTNGQVAADEPPQRTRSMESDLPPPPPLQMGGWSEPSSPPPVLGTTSFEGAPRVHINSPPHPYPHADVDGPGADSFQAEAANWFSQSFQLNLCGKRIGAKGAQKLITAG